MTPEQWQAVKKLFHEALDQAPEGRAAFLEHACAGDATLRGEVETLLSCERDAGGFLEKPAAATVPVAEPDAIVGRRIGAYRVLGAVGRGGMGSVYLAVRDDDAFHKEVAIKLVRAWGESDFLVERFRQERHILAALEHPNIARLLDAGTTEEGLPYLVMELVDGIPIDEYCAEHESGVRDRLALFRTVCSAVHFAHQNLVVHRDIKPANILITADGTPKLLDFGIAKLLSADIAARGQTATAFPMMTPEYASPEQVRNEPISTASDVYSLGVLLYRLLTGRGPYRVTTGSVLEVIEAVRDQEPLRPSATSPRLDRDLDNIVLRALRKEPRERYASVEEFSADVGRYLAGQPVIARKATIPYRAAKFVRRHKVGVAAAVLVFASLVGGIVATVREARIARVERARAERRFNDVRKLANSFLFEVHDAIEKLPGSTAARELVVKRALEYLDSLAKETSGDPSLQQELAAAYERVGDVQGRVVGPHLGETAAARTSYAKALSIREALVAADPRKREFRRDLADSYTKNAETSFATGDPKRAAEMHGKALGINEALAAEEPSSAVAKQRLAASLRGVGYMLGASNDAKGGVDNLRRSVRLFEQLAAAAPDDAMAQARLAMARKALGDVLFEIAGDAAAALDEYQKSVATVRRLVSADPSNPYFRRALTGCLDSMADLSMSTGNLASALESLREALAILESMAAADPANAQARIDVGIIRMKVGNAQAQLGQVDEALANLRAALRVHEAGLVADPSDAMVRSRLAGTSTGMAKAHSVAAANARTAPERIRNWREARAWYQKARDLWLALRNQGATAGNENAEPEKLAVEIARCDEALAKLGGGSVAANLPR